MGNVKRVFVNLVAHKLLEEQVEMAKREFDIEEIVEAEEVVGRELLEKLRQCPANEEELLQMAYELSKRLVEYAKKNGVELYVHLPVGSPAFMWAFSKVFPRDVARAVFSHTKREVVEEKQQDGSVVKKSVFKFEKFIVF